MATFCSNCRFPLAASASFCPQCGRPQAATQSAQRSPASGGGSAIKVVMVVVLCLTVAGIAAVGVSFYAFHKAKQAVVAKAESYGIDLKSIPSPMPSSNSSQRKIYKPCEILPKAEASELLGEPIDRTDVVEESCVYFGPPGLAEKLATEDTAAMMNKAKTGAQMNGGDVADTVSKMLGAVAAKSGQNGLKGGEEPLLTFLVDPDGRPQMFAVAANKSFFGRIGADSGGEGLGAEIPNLGDRAIRLGPLGLNVLKGDTVIRIVVGPVPDANNKAVAIARAVLPRV